MKLFCTYHNKSITHDLTKWIACPIRSMCAGCWYLENTTQHIAKEVLNTMIKKAKNEEHL